MKYFFKFLFTICLFTFLLVYLLPKINMYFQFENFLKKQEIILLNKNINESKLGIDLNNTEFYYKKEKIANIKEIVFFTIIFKTKLDLQTINLSKYLNSYFPNKIDNITLSHSLINPLNIILTSKGKYGYIKGNIHLLSKKIKLRIFPKKGFPMNNLIIKSLKKDEKGVYTYEYQY